ncbi:hypothetical protein [Bosea sp. 124]|nr:hypothetical protein [Bosea sp. 124]
MPKAAGFGLKTIADHGLDANSSARALPALAPASSATASISRID